MTTFDSDYMDVGDKVWFVTRHQRWRTDSIRNYTIDSAGNIESINGEKLTGGGYSSEKINEDSLIDILQFEPIELPAKQ